MGDRPNLLLFMPDQLRADSVGAFGNTAVHTPAIDAFAREAMRFDNAYAQNSACTQSRVSLVTGWYPHVAGYRTIDNLLAPHEPNLFQNLRSAGYHVALTGARGDMFSVGGTRAFSDRYGFTTPPDLAAVAEWFSSPFDETSKWAGSFYGGTFPEEPFDMDAATVATAIDWLIDGLPEPWCLFIPLMYPHPPFKVAEPWLEPYRGTAMPPPLPPALDTKPGFHRAIHTRYGLNRLDSEDWATIRRTYYGMISRVDDQFRLVREAIGRAGCGQRTITFFFTDHGEYLGDFGLVEKWPSGLDEVLLRNPLLIHDPDAAPGATDALVELLDLTATIEDYADVTPQHTHFGRSLRTLVHDPDQAHRDAVFSEGGFDPTYVQRAEDEQPMVGHYANKLAIEREEPELVGRAMSVRTADWCYVMRRHEDPELYNRRTDRPEQVNLAGSPELANIEHTMRDRLLTWMLETSDVVPTTRDPRMDPDLTNAIMGKS